MTNHRHCGSWCTNVCLEKFREKCGGLFLQIWFELILHMFFMRLGRAQSLNASLLPVAIYLSYETGLFRQRPPHDETATTRREHDTNKTTATREGGVTASFTTGRQNDKNTIRNDDITTPTHPTHPTHPPTHPPTQPTNQQRRATHDMTRHHNTHMYMYMKMYVYMHMSVSPKPLTFHNGRMFPPQQQSVDTTNHARKNCKKKIIIIPPG